MSAAAAPAQNDVVVVEDGAQEVQILDLDLLANDPEGSAIVSFSPTSCGELDREPTGFVYRPDPELFSEVGTDSFRYDFSGSTSGSAIVFLVADAYDAAAVDLPLTAIVSPTSLRVSEGSLVPLAALDRTFALKSTDGVTVNVDTYEPGRGDEGGKIEADIDPIPLTLPPGQEVVVGTAGAGGATAIELLLRYDGGYQLQARGQEDSGMVWTTPWADVAAGLQEVAVSWWSESAESAGDGGLAVSRDGMVIAAISGAESFDAELGIAVRARFGLVDPGVAVTGTMRLENPRLWHEPATEPLLEPIFADGVETGDLVAWSGSFGPVAVTSQAAILGAWGVAVPASVSGFLSDASPAAETRYRARFHLDLSALTMPEGNQETLLAGFDESGESRRFSVGVRRQDATWMLCGEATPNQGAPISVGCFALAAVPGRVGVQWWAAESSLEADGGLVLRIDGSLAGYLTGLANDGQSIEEIRFGAFEPEVGTAGEYHLDGFESWR